MKARRDIGKEILQGIREIKRAARTLLLIAANNPAALRRVA